MIDNGIKELYILQLYDVIRYLLCPVLQAFLFLSNRRMQYMHFYSSQMEDIKRKLQYNFENQINMTVF